MQNKGFLSILLAGIVSAISIILLAAGAIYLKNQIPVKNFVPIKEQALSNQEFLNFTSQKGGFSISYPRDWIVDDYHEYRHLPLTANFKDPENQSFFLASTTVGKDTRRDSLEVVTEDHLATIKRFDPNNIQPEYRQKESTAYPLVGKISVSALKDITVDGNPTKIFNFEVKGEKSGKGMSVIICCVPKNPASPTALNDYYSLLAIAYPPDESKTLKIFEEMANSLKVLPVDWSNLYKTNN